MAHTHPLNGDGISAEFFKCLLKQSHDDIDVKFLIPDTIVFYSSASIWYYYDRRTRRMKKRNAKELDKEVIYEYMRRELRGKKGGVAWTNARSSGIVCTFTSTRTGATGPDDVLFMGSEQLRSFLYDSSTERYGFLQKFIPSKSPHNEVLQCVWSPQMTFSVKRTNRARFNDRAVDRYTKAVTFEGPTHYSDEVLCTPGMTSALGAACASFVQHFGSIEPHYTVTRMCAYFKYDPDDTLYLMYVSSLRVTETEWRNISATPNPIMLYLHDMEPDESSTANARPRAWTPLVEPITAKANKKYATTMTAKERLTTHGQIRTASASTMKHASREEVMRLFQVHRKVLNSKLHEIRLRNTEQAQMLEESLMSAAQLERVAKSGRTSAYHSSPGRPSASLPGASVSMVSDTTPIMSQSRGSRARPMAAASLCAGHSIVGDVSLVPLSTGKKQSHDAAGRRKVEKLERLQVHRAFVMHVVVNSHIEASDPVVAYWRQFQLDLNEVVYEISDWAREASALIRSKGDRAVLTPHRFTLPGPVDDLFKLRYAHVYRDVCATPVSDAPHTYEIGCDRRVPAVGMVHAMERVLTEFIQARADDPGLIETGMARRYAGEVMSQLVHELVAVVTAREANAARLLERQQRRGSMRGTSCRNSPIEPPSSEQRQRRGGGVNFAGLARFAENQEVGAGVV
eukprot:PhM_4_TR12005/c0_g1_i1/m.59953